MRKYILFASAMLTASITSSLVAQEADQTVAPVATVPVESAPPTCELRVFPSLERTAYSVGLLSALGGAAGAALEMDANKKRALTAEEYLESALGPEFQVRALSEIDLVSELDLPEGTEVTFETPIEDRKITTKSTTRLTSSTAPCYAELLVTQNMYQSVPFRGRSLNNRFIFKDFRTGKTETKLIKGRGGNGLEHFPPENAEGIEAADEDVRQAFAANFLEYAKKFK